jgi:hypothetical protein
MLIGQLRVTIRTITVQIVPVITHKRELIDRHNQLRAKTMRLATIIVETTITSVNGITPVIAYREELTDQ